MVIGMESVRQSRGIDPRHLPISTPLRFCLVKSDKDHPILELSRVIKGNQRNSEETKETDGLPLTSTLKLWVRHAYISQQIY